jgi:hypothetical protein
VIYDCRNKMIEHSVTENLTKKAHAIGMGFFEELL